MGFSETIFLFILALVVFGPKKLPEIARQAGKLLAELRRASNEFKSQIETEITHLERDERDKAKQVAALPTGPPTGAVASLSLNPATPPEALAATASATLAATAESAAAPDPAASLPIETVQALPIAHAESTNAPVPQDSHV